ncbi:hypothetical protein CA85_21440 [Allorhodopirellula solitaria]|uniref:Uncharacterized protein n=1 Tax=Allorhodopirellula solitaria TaxID=2527987 RepID=A0A5C5XWJ8_9BACT|nr:hypothetical protein CA85_21440 [Allorhodopirellula solitaria]
MVDPRRETPWSILGLKKRVFDQSGRDTRLHIEKCIAALPGTVTNSPAPPHARQRFRFHDLPDWHCARTLYTEAASLTGLIQRR